MCVCVRARGCACACMCVIPVCSYELIFLVQIRNEVSSSHKGSPILPDEGVKEVFLNIAQIYVLNRGLLKDLDERMKTWYVHMST